MVRGIVALLLVVVVGALIGSGGHLEVLVPGWAPAAAREPRPDGARPTGQSASAGAELRPSDLKDASPAQLREAVRANPELLAGKSTGELVSMYQQYKQSSR